MNLLIKVLSDNYSLPEELVKKISETPVNEKLLNSPIDCYERFEHQLIIYFASMADDFYTDLDLDVEGVKDPEKVNEFLDMVIECLDYNSGFKIPMTHLN